MYKNSWYGWDIDFIDMYDIFQQVLMDKNKEKTIQVYDKGKFFIDHWRRLIILFPVM